MSKEYNVTVYCELCGRPEIHDEMDCIDNLRGDLQKRDAENERLKANQNNLIDDIEALQDECERTRMIAMKKREKIISLRTENAAQAQTIERLRGALEYLIKQLDFEKEHEKNGCHYCGANIGDNAHYENCPYTKAQDALKAGE